MTDRMNNSLAALLTPAPAKGVQFSQGVVLSWDNETLHNTIEWRGITLTDIPIIEGINALTIRQGDVIGMLGWAPENAKGVGSWWILGKLTNPGETVADLNITAKLIRFVTEDGSSLAFFGKEADGDPLWILYYGESDNQAAIRIADNNYISILDRTGNEVFGTDGFTGVGISRPWIPFRMVPSGPAQISGTSFWPTTPNAAYTQMMNGTNPCFHPRISIGVATTTTGGGTAGWQFRINGTTVFTNSGSASTTVDVPGWGSTINPGDVLDMELYGRVEGGATRAFFQCDRLYGRQS